MRETPDNKSKALQRNDIALRTTDLVLATILLLILGPLMLLIALLIRIDSAGPILFRQSRVGLHGQLFTMYKFRSMWTDADQWEERRREWLARALRGECTTVNGSYKLHADPRITRIGAILRKTSLDELPQLFNVIKGDMALVGPRPCLSWEAEMFPAEFRSRFDVRPGVTGLWQISGRSTLSPLEMLELDVTYVHTRSIRTEVRVLALTLPALIKGGGAR